MDAMEVIESYVHDVARRLPRKQRNDVAFELRALLQEELFAKAEGAGRPADEAMAKELLSAFGHPAMVATRYRPPLTIIDEADGRAFLRATSIGLAIVWAVGAFGAFNRPLDSISAVLFALRDWWLGAVIPSLWWPGFLVVCFGGIAYMRRRWPDSGEWKPPAMDRDTVSRLAYAVAIVAAIGGLFILVNAAWLLDSLLAGRAAPLVAQIFAFDEDFWRFRAPVLATFMAAQLILYVVLIVQGRWVPLIRKIDLAISIAICVVLAWVVMDGAIYQYDSTNNIVKVILVLIVAGSLIDIVVKLKRQFTRLRVPPGVISTPTASQ